MINYMENKFNEEYIDGSLKILHLSKEFKKQRPIKHIYIKNFFNKETLSFIDKEWPKSPDLSIDTEVNKRSFYRSNLSDNLTKLIQASMQKKFVSLLEKITGYEHLLVDKTLENAGLHETFDRGFLGMHIDNRLHSEKNKVRVLNLIVYLSKNWKKENRGNLVLSSLDEENKKNIFPFYNSAILFEVNSNSLHGAPSQFLKSADCFSRRSLALFFYQSSDKYEELDASVRTKWSHKNKIKEYNKF